MEGSVVDPRSVEQRRKIMQSVGTVHTRPEMVVRQNLYALGYRYRLHRKDLPGKPDIVFVTKRKVIFVNGCFWHGHGCPKGRLPKSRLDYWGPKIERNRQRDREIESALRLRGWDVLTVWQCELKDLHHLRCHLSAFLGPGKKPIDI
ncbi:very short patch repair endonuclease [Pseudomonas serboccidentalis]|uniref:Very short patch repair endonuclease n=1 Tax=Pseudomonas serboccidentalis TaxID=2964670 RepID=A0ABY7Z9F2_9PSED|nr:very short patch repair endonuclease [Pseudomonas serboccidentalis]WDR36191.1 very short patch repair endonuclease [Pseudomonas serboccidentalis]